MIETLHYIRYFYLFLPLLFFSSCTDGDGVRELRASIREAAKDGLIDEEECARLRAASKNHKEMQDFSNQDWESFLLKNKPRGVEVLSVACTSQPNPAPAVAPSNSICAGKPDKVNVYIENSGSMYGYLDPQSAFYKNVTDLIVQFNDHDQDFAYHFINTDTFRIADLPGENSGATNAYGKKSHLESWLVQSKMSKKGDKSSSKLMKALNQISKLTLNDCQPRMLFSDFVYSIINNQNMEKEMTKVQSDMSLIFNDVAKAGLATLIIKFESEFDGIYYPRDDPNGGYKYKGLRPFYCWMIASPEYIESFPKTYTIDQLPGYQASMAVAPVLDTTPEYSIMPYSGKPYGKFRAEPRGKGVKVTGLTNVLPSERSATKGLRIAVGTNLAGLSPNDIYLTNPDNYRITGGGGEDGWHIDEVLAGDIVDPRDFGRMRNNPTHLLMLRADVMKAQKRALEISLLDKQPSWLVSSHTDSDLEPEIDAIKGKTFGFKYLANGLWDAYHPRRDELVFFTLPLTLER